ncbi:Dihydroorotate dehydrogenase (quinone), mitochondrial [Rhizina undulata]
MPLLRPSSSLLRAATQSARSAAPKFSQRRQASSAAGNSFSNKFRNGVIGSAIIAAVGFSYLSLTDTRSSVHRYQVVPFLRWLYNGDDIAKEEGGRGPGAERAHEIGLKSLRALYDIGFGLRERGQHEYLETPGMGVEVFGHRLNSPLAISAGLDKHAECIDPLFNLSPSISIVEVGCITPLPQAGNPRPRMFRLPTSQSLINRYGFNSQGADAAAIQLRGRVRRYALKHGMTEQEVLDSDIPASLWENRLLAVQIGKNKATPETDIEAVKQDYERCVERIGKYADIIVVNVSSPNTPGLRSLQKRESLEDLLQAVVSAANEVKRKNKPKVVVKVSPDSDSDADVKDISAAVRGAKVDGIIVSNTTVERHPELTASPQTTEEEKRIAKKEMGGLSGPSLLPKMLGLVERYHKELDDEVVLFASGGITSGNDVLEARKRGAKIVMAYTGMVYDGVGFFGKIGRELSRALKGE